MTVKTSAEKLAADLSVVSRFVHEEWETLSHYEKIELLRQAGALPPPANLKLLGELFEQLESPVFQAQILSTLVVAGTVSEVPSFLESALRANNSRIRANAVEALAGIRADSLRASVGPLLDDEDNRVRANAAIYLWAYEDIRPRVKAVLESMAAGSDPWTRASAIYAAGRLLDSQFDGMLVAALDDEYEPSVVAALRALLKRTYPHMVRRAASLLADARPSTALWHVCADVLLELGGTGPDVEDGLLHALASTGDRELQDKLLRVLAHQESPTVAGKLLEFLERLDAGEFHLCQRLLEIVGRQGTAEHRSRLQALASTKLTLYADLLDRASKEISRRHGRWWKP